MTACRQPACVRHLRRIPVLLLFAVCCLSAQATQAQIFQRSLAFQNARILTMDGREYDEGTLVVTGDKIRAVGAAVKVPAFAKQTDVDGATITPGFIDANGLLGRADLITTSGAGATRRAEDAFDRYDTASFEEALRQGVTALYLSPVGPVGISGTGAIMRLARRDANGPMGDVLKSEAALCIDLGSANKAVTRIKTMQSIRKSLTAAQRYRRSLADYEDDLEAYMKQRDEQAKKAGEAAKKESPKVSVADGESKKEPEVKKSAAKPAESTKPKKPRKPTRNLSYELLLRAIDSEIPVRVIAHRSSDILNALELADEFSLRLIVEGASEAYLVAEQVARADVAVVLGRMDLPAQRRADIFRRRIEHPGAVLDATGVRWFVGSGASSAARSRFVLQNAQLATGYAGGSDPLQLVTAGAADVLEVTQIGRLRPGALADFVVWSGDPLDPATKALRVFVSGREVYAMSP